MILKAEIPDIPSMLISCHRKWWFNKSDSVVLVAVKAMLTHIIKSVDVHDVIVLTFQALSTVVCAAAQRGSVLWIAPLVQAKTYSGLTGPGRLG